MSGGGVVCLYVCECVIESVMYVSVKVCLCMCLCMRMLVSECNLGVYGCVLVCACVYDCVVCMCGCVYACVCVCAFDGRFKVMAEHVQTGTWDTPLPVVVVQCWFATIL